MKKLSKKHPLLRAVILVMSAMPAYACRPDTAPFEYAVQDEHIVWREGGRNGIYPAKHLPELNLQDFHSLLAATPTV